MATEVKKHAKYSASSSERWMACPGSIDLSLRAPPEVESKYALEGTRAHECLESFLKNGQPKSVANHKMLCKSYPEKMVSYALGAAQEIWAMVPKGAELLSESKCDLSHISPDMWGTTDAAIVELFGRLTVIDFKYGAGVAVDPEENSQMAFYALGIAHQYDYNFEDVALVIVQPRAEHPSGNTTREWVLSIDDLIKWGDKFKAGVEACEDLFAELTPGKWCRFCRAKPICPAISDQALQEAKLDFDDKGSLLEPDYAVLTNLDMGRALGAAGKLEEWIASIREMAQARLEDGQTIPGWKLVAKRGQRQWTDEEKAAKEARMIYGPVDPFTAPKLLSPAQFEKVIVKTRGDTAKKWMEAHVETVSSGNTIAPSTDRRQEVGSIDIDFDVVPRGIEAAIEKNFNVMSRTVEADGTLVYSIDIRPEKDGITEKALANRRMIPVSVQRKPSRNTVRAMSKKKKTKATKAKRKR